jgi:hypothetical protein
VFYDITTAFIFGLPSLVEYDASEFPTIPEVTQPLEWVHGIPVELTVNLMLVNAWRAAHPGIPNANEWVGLEMRTMAWEPRIAQLAGEDSLEVVARLAVQESWRHAVLIYIYMVSFPSISEYRGFDNERIINHRACVASRPTIFESNPQSDRSFN